MTGGTLQGRQLRLVLLAHGQQCLALESRLVAGCHRLTGHQPPEAQTICLDRLLNLPDSASAGQQLLLELKQGGTTVFGLWSGSADLIEVAAAAIHPLPPVLSARKHWPALTALLLMNDQGIIPLFDVEKIA